MSRPVSSEAEDQDASTRPATQTRRPRRRRLSHPPRLPRSPQRPRPHRDQRPTPTRRPRRHDHRPQSELDRLEDAEPRLRRPTQSRASARGRSVPARQDPRQPRPRRPRRRRRHVTERRRRVTLFIDGNRATPGTTNCRCYPICDFPCWQRIGLTPPCAQCRCGPFAEATIVSATGRTLDAVRSAPLQSDGVGQATPSRVHDPDAATEQTRMVTPNPPQSEP